MVPFDEDDDDESSGKGGGQARGDDGKFASKGGKAEPEDDSVELEDDEDGSVTVRTREPSQPRVRDEKKRVRYEEIELRARTAELERDQARMHLQMQQQQAPRVPEGPNPEIQKHEQRIQELREQRDLRWQTFMAKGSKASPEERAEFKKKAEQLEESIADAMAERREASRQRPQQSQNNPASVVSAMMQAEFPDVMGDPRAYNYADGLARVHRASGGNLDLAKMRELLQQGRAFRQNGYQESRRPTAQQKRQYSGRPTGPSSNAREEPLTLSPELQKKILLTHKKPGESDSATLKRWAAKNGKKFQERLKERA